MTNKISLVSKVTKVLIMLGMLIQIAIFVSFMISDSATSSMTYVLENDHINASLINEQWLPFAHLLEKIGFDSFWLLGPVDFLMQMALLFFLFSLFSLYEKNIIFTVKNSRYLFCIGGTFFIYGLLMIVYPALVSLLIRLMTDTGDIGLNLYFGSVGLSNIIWGVVIIVISWIMKEASMLKEEQGLVI